MDPNETQFRERVGSVPVGEKYAEATLPDGRTVREGDVVAFDDPDLRSEDLEKGIRSRLFVGYVEALLDPNRGDEVEVFATTPIGRLDAKECEFSGEGSTVDSQSGTQKFVERLLNTDHDAITLEWGDNIAGSGKDFRETPE